MARQFIAQAIKHPGALHEDLGVPQGKTIPAAAIDAAAKEPGKVGERARFAKTLRKMNKKHKSAPKAKAAPAPKPKPVAPPSGGGYDPALGT